MQALQTLPEPIPAATDAMPPPATATGSHRARLLREVARSVYRGSLYKLNFAVNGVCNSRCVTCDIWKDENPPSGPHGGDLSLDEIGRFFARIPDTVNWLSLTGGEPHLRKDFAQIVHEAIRRIPNLHLIGSPSNGLLPDRVMGLVESLLGHPHPLMFLSFSIDGPPEVHDRVRGIPGGFRKTWETYEAVRRATRGDPDFVISVETTVSSHNVTQVSPFLEETLDAGHLLTITIGHNAFLYVNAQKGSVSPLSQRAALGRVLRVMRSRTRLTTPKGLVERRYLDGILRYADRPRRQVVPCTALRASVSIDHRGDVHPCLMWGRPIGNLRDVDYDIARLLSSDEGRAARREVKREQCPNCWTPCEAYQSIIGRALKPF